MSSSNHKRIVAIIPARGGSKRIPGKNIIDFMGKPLIAWTIEAARDSGLFEKIVVSTDSEEIATVARQWGAEVPGLRDSKADDYSPVSEATIRTLQLMEEQGIYFDEVIQLFAVCPLRNAQDIINAYQYFVKSKSNFLISCFKYTWMNPWWAVTLDQEGHPSWIFEDAKKRSQDLPELFSPTGAIWVANVEALYNENTFYGNGHVFWEMNWKRAVDIDNYEDLELAKMLGSAEQKDDGI
ncbi:acylneuraminate cytidylyltransferase family protein [Chryseotalea sanaruensis]|uniref:Acylneuraminate cytidylyltransferase family protein n=1 Tax=Chryseotalea sanaruensis TaxID=2482724 RepID=A0A401U6P4_9BACT|nr:acylneuraminate cytidylyltransferase family protein [Chryseotalea sanaruensis]GCC50611.1 acylneuraminate cytidylyltransferase family protein [Chryseotalea sanaruensis]